VLFVASESEAQKTIAFKLLSHSSYSTSVSSLADSFSSLLLLLLLLFYSLLFYLQKKIRTSSFLS